jgi:benzoyl-CoA reductase/2-hydroxyglutaryl-CoA dehydratase subunit BcrC/BadD/HgdB
MNWLEKEIERNKKRIKKIDESSNPFFLRSNKLLYENELDLRMAQLEAWKTGNKPIMNSEYATVLMNAMGCIGLDLVGIADRTGLASDYFEIIREQGFPDHACDRTIVSLAMCINGDLPVPDIVLAHNTACHMELLSFKALAEKFKKPVYVLNGGLGASEESLKFVTDQMMEFIEFAEKKVPGVRYDEERMIEIIDVERKALDCAKEINRLRAHIPCLISGLDAFRLPRFPSYYPDHSKAL